MEILRQYGQTLMRLSDLVDDFCLRQGNMRQANYLRYLVFARWAWDDMYRDTIWNIKSVALQPCHDKGHTTIKLPDNCERLVNISTVDRFGKLHPLTPDSDFNTVEVKCQKCACSCEKCHGKDTLCAVLDNVTYTTEQVDIKGTFYTLKTWIRYDGSGVLQKEQSIPTFDSASNSITYQTVFTILCNLDIDEKGCIKATAPNMSYLVDYCGWDGSNSWWNGWGATYQPYKTLIPPVYNYFGYWKKNAADPQIIHLFRNEYPVHNGSVENANHHSGGFGTIIVTYQTNGEVPDEEILVPQYAVAAVHIGMLYQQKVYNPKDGDPNNAGLYKFNASKIKVMRYLNPIRMEVVEKLQQQARPW